MSNAQNHHYKIVNMSQVGNFQNMKTNYKSTDHDVNYMDLMG